MALRLFWILGLISLMLGCGGNSGETVNNEPKQQLSYRTVTGTVEANSAYTNGEDTLNKFEKVVRVYQDQKTFETDLYIEMIKDFEGVSVDFNTQQVLLVVLESSGSVASIYGRSSTLSFFDGVDLSITDQEDYLDASLSYFTCSTYESKENPNVEVVFALNAPDRIVYAFIIDSKKKILFQESYLEKLVCYIEDNEALLN